AHVFGGRRDIPESAAGARSGGFAVVADEVDFDAGGSGVAGGAGVDEDAAVGFIGGAVFEAEDEVVIGVVGGQPAFALLVAEDAVLDGPGSVVGAALDGLPVGEGLAVEEELESVLLFLGC